MGRLWARRHLWLTHNRRMGHLEGLLGHRLRRGAAHGTLTFTN